MKKLSILITFLSIFCIPLLVNAQEVSPVEQIREAVKEKVQEKVQGITERKLSLVGTLSKIDISTIQVDVNQQKFTVSTSENTEYFQIPGRRKITQSDLELNQYLIVMGIQATGEEVISGKIIQSIPKPEIPQRHTLYGRITNISNKSLTLETNDNQTWTVTYLSSTNITEKTQKNTIGKIKTSALAENDTIITGGTLDDSNSQELTALLIHRLPSLSATPSVNSNSNPSPEAGASAETE